jgi:hypothetical protein
MATSALEMRSSMMGFVAGLRLDFSGPTAVHAQNAAYPQDRRSARLAIVEQHIRLDNEHDLEGVLGTFGDTARYDDEPWDDHYTAEAACAYFTSSS